MIVALYQPGPPEAIAKIQEVLQRLQRSPEGWELGQSLLGSSDDNIKFFGALTLIVKINTERCLSSFIDMFQFGIRLANPDL